VNTELTSPLREVIDNMGHRTSEQGWLDLELEESPRAQEILGTLFFDTQKWNSIKVCN